MHPFEGKNTEWLHSITMKRNDRVTFLVFVKKKIDPLNRKLFFPRNGPSSIGKNDVFLMSFYILVNVLNFLIKQ